MSFNFVFNINIRLFQEAQKWITLSNEKSILKYFPVSENYFYVNLFFFYLLTVQLPLHITFCLGRKWNKCMLLIFYIMGLLPDFPSLAYLQYSVSSVAQSCPTLCDPTDCIIPGFPVHHQLPELAQTHVYLVL